MENRSADWQRIQKLIEYSGEKSVTAFAHRIGLKRGENLYQIKRGNNKISRELAEKIVECFPEIAKSWLLTGEGGAGVPEKTSDNEITLHLKITLKVEK